MRAGLMGAQVTLRWSRGTSKPFRDQRPFPPGRGGDMALLTAAPGKGCSIGNQESLLTLGEQGQVQEDSPHTGLPCLPLSFLFGTQDLAADLKTQPCDCNAIISGSKIIPCNWNTVTINNICLLGILFLRCVIMLEYLPLI